MAGRRDVSAGIRLRTHLLALFLGPGLLAVLLLSLVSSAQLGKVQDADRSVSALDAQARVGVVQTALLNEMIPAFASYFAVQPAQANGGGLSGVALGALGAMGRGQGATAARRAETDRALNAIGVERDRVAEVRRLLSGVREAVDRPEISLGEVIRQIIGVSSALAAVEDAEQVVLSRSGHSARLAGAVETAHTTSQLVATAEFERGLLIAASVVDSPDMRSQWVQIWGSSTALQARMDREVSGTTAVAWQRAQQDPAVTRSAAASQAFFDSGMVVPATFSPEFLGNLLRTILDLQAGSTAYRDLHIVADAEVRALVLDERGHAVTALWLLVAACVAAVALFGSVALVLVRSVTRPLARLAGDARRISQGVLVDVEPTGPREVRTVGRALESAVATLHRVQSQVEAVARGQLDHEMLREPVPGPLGQVLHESIERALTSIQDREVLQLEMEHLAAHDGLTGLPNRAEVLALAERALVTAAGTGEAVAMLFMDLDHFKKVNDGFGHAAGDTVLREIAARLVAEVRVGDVVGRLGGDEFVVLVDQFADPSALLELAHRLVRRVGDPVEIGERSVAVGVSIGMTVCLGGALDADLMLREADAAAYRAKAAGRGRVDVFDDALREDLRARAELEADLQAGIARGDLVLHYQPIVDVATGVVEGYEALVRWDRPGVGLLPPDAFIPVAEQSTLVCQLGRWVLGEALRQLAQWNAEGRSVSVAINLSGRHFADDSVVEDVREALRATGADPARVVLELTETVMVHDDAAHLHLRQLRELGVRIALDDFGTGYTSIGQLQRLHVDILKIDRAFVSETHCPAGRELVALMIRAGHASGLLVVAEGVELPEQLAVLEELKCDSAQGYLFARPLPAAAALEAVARLSRP